MTNVNFSDNVIHPVDITVTNGKQFLASSRYQKYMIKHPQFLSSNHASNQKADKENLLNKDYVKFLYQEQLQIGRKIVNEFEHKINKVGASSERSSRNQSTQATRTVARIYNVADLNVPTVQQFGQQIPKINHQGQFMCLRSQSQSSHIRKYNSKSFLSDYS